MMLSRTTRSVLVRPNPISCRLGLSRLFATTSRPGPAIPFATTPKPATATATPTPTTPAATTATPKGSTGSGSGSGSDSGSSRPIPNTLYDYIIGNRSTILVTFAVVSTLGYAWRCNQMEKACKEQIKIREYVIDDLQLALTRAEENQRATLELIEQHTGKRKRAPATTSTSASTPTSSSSGWWPFSSSAPTPTPTPKSSTTSTPTHKPSGSLYDDVLSLYRSHPLLAAPNILNSADVARHLTNNDTIPATATTTTTPTPAASSTPTPTPTPATKTPASTPPTTASPTAPTAPAGGARPLM